ncbi:HAD family acid phosphatase [Halobacteriovorax sp. HLS]|uniref:phosphatase domain-containing protein n=1 Tax=Halobacteriovorax sp. HLS TaxID=2234000 RepID=UPI000FD73AA1|nr:HAD family acid phosphatase [Halobacteriovorax sp. HLS]
MKEVIVVDLDGTLADCEHRVHHVEQVPKDWKSFNEKMEFDKLNLWCKKIIDSMRSNGIETVLLTGRGEENRDKTLKWLEENGVEFLDLYMRPVGDEREDAHIKKEIYLEKIAPSYKTLFVIEDRLSVVKMWRSIDVTCLQCEWGDF